MRLYLPAFSVALLLSATLLFSVQPMFSKMLLPLLGGTPQVWNTAMLFFQAFLLCGYAYAHITSRLMSAHLQAIFHIFLLCVFIVILPIAIPEGWEPSLEHDPTLWQLSVMAVAVGGPFFVISGSAPMLQHWFSKTKHKDAHNPYFLYGASNLGSMVALLSYPTIIEPLMGADEQSYVWMYGYIALIALTSICALLTWKNVKDKEILQETPIEEFYKTTTRMRLKWIAFSFVPSSLMLGVTTYITTNIASVPLLWIVPFALYVSTFIIVFARKQLFNENQVMAMSGCAIILLIVQMISFQYVVYNSPFILVALHILVFFTTALACHYYLAHSKPHVKGLTEFYLFMSLGGVLGGVFNALIAPNFFLLPIEYALAIIAALLIRYSASKSIDYSLIKNLTLNRVLVVVPPAIISFVGFYYGSSHYIVLSFCSLFIAVTLLLTLKSHWKFSFIASICILLSPISTSFFGFDQSTVIYRDRNFFGVHKVLDTETTRFFASGVTVHGAQLRDEKHKLTRLTYYSVHSPLQDVFTYLDNLPDTQQTIGVLGLGVGVTACNAREGRTFDFYEIDKDIADIAENTNYFTYLSECGSPYKIIIGDGRLEIEKKYNQIYDAIVIDAFSSDNIPVHVITKEAIQIYIDKLKDNGVLAVHITNNHLDLEPVLHEIGKALDIPAYSRFSKKTLPIRDTKALSFPAHYVVLTHSKDMIEVLKRQGWKPTSPRRNVNVWTDQYSNILSVLGNAHNKTIRKESAE